MKRVKCKYIIFSSSATVYGEPQYLPIDENHPYLNFPILMGLQIMFEKIIKDWCKTDNEKKNVIT